MRDKAEIKYDEILKKHREYIKIGITNFDKDKQLESVQIELKTGVVIYVIDFTKKSVSGTDVDVVNKFEVSRADILNGSFAKSFDGFYSYDAKRRLGLMMGMGYISRRGNDVEIITPKFVGNIYTDGMNISTILNAVKEDMPEIYDMAGRAPRDFTARQGPAGKGIGAAKRKKEEVVTYVFSVHEITGISERSGAPIFAKGIEVKVRRAYYDSAQNFVKSKYSYQKTKKHYFVELKRIDK